MKKALILAAVAALASGAAAAKTSAHDDWSPPVALTLDQAQTIEGTEVACTGIGQTRADPKWATFPVRLEFANRGSEYLVGAVVNVSDARGRSLFTVSCDAPWVLLRLPPGTYRVQARLSGAPAAAVRSATVTPPRTGQARVVLTFPDA